jgi:hypothetical protein
MKHMDRTNAWRRQLGEQATPTTTGNAATLSNCATGTYRWEKPAPMGINHIRTNMPRLQSWTRVTSALPQMPGSITRGVVNCLLGTIHKQLELLCMDQNLWELILHYIDSAVADRTIQTMGPFSTALAAQACIGWLKILEKDTRPLNCKQHMNTIPDAETRRAYPLAKQSRTHDMARIDSIMEVKEPWTPLVGQRKQQQRKVRPPQRTGGDIQQEAPIPNLSTTTTQSIPCHPHSGNSHQNCWLAQHVQGNFCRNMGSILIDSSLKVVPRRCRGGSNYL